MTVSKQIVAEKIAAYLRHQLSLAELVCWSEDVLMDGDLAEEDGSVLADVIARLGAADVRGFGLTWDDCQELLALLGYTARVDIVAA